MKNSLRFKNIRERNAYIIGQLNAKKTIGEVSNKVGISKRQVKRIRKSHRINGRLGRKKGSGRPHVLNKTQKLKLLQLVKWNFGKPLSSIIRENNLGCTTQTARNYLRSIGFSYQKTQKKPHLNKENITDRLFLAQSCQGYPFDTTIFVDECVFEVGEPFYGWGPVGQPYYIDAYQFPPKVNVWGLSQWKVSLI